MVDTKMELSGFLDMRLKPVGEELSASGAGHVIAAFVPAGGLMKIITDRLPVEGALMLRQMAEAMLRKAEELERTGADTPFSGLILPPH